MINILCSILLILIDSSNLSAALVSGPIRPTSPVDIKSGVEKNISDSNSATFTENQDLLKVKQQILKKASNVGLEEEQFIPIKNAKLAEAGLSAVDPMVFNGSLETTDQNPDTIEYILLIKQNLLRARAGQTTPTHVILGGPPGTGKTYTIGLLAKSLYKETNGGFILFDINTTVLTTGPIIADLFQEMIDQATSLNKPCILFLDEVDSIARSLEAGGTQEIARSLLQGVNKIKRYNETVFSRSQKGKPVPCIVIFGATNFMSMLDDAFLQRFSYKDVLIPNPGIQAKIYSRLLSDGINKKTSLLRREDRSIPNQKITITPEHPVIKILVEKGSGFSPREISEQVVKPFCDSILSRADLDFIKNKLMIDKPVEEINLKTISKLSKDLYNSHLSNSVKRVILTRKAQIKRDLSAGNFYLNTDSEISSVDTSLLKYTLGYQGEYNHFEVLTKGIKDTLSYKKDVANGKVPKNTRRSYLFYGPPGTGKTMIMKSFAKETESPIVLLDSSQLADKFVGSGSTKITKALDVSKLFHPSIVAFDEAELAAPDPSAVAAEDTSRLAQSATIQNAMNVNNNFLSQESPTIFILATNFYTSVAEAVRRRCICLEILYPNYDGSLACIDAAINNYNKKNDTSLSLNQSSLTIKIVTTNETIDLVDSFFFRGTVKKNGIDIVFWRRPNTDDWFKITDKACAQTKNIDSFSGKDLLLAAISEKNGFQNIIYQEKQIKKILADNEKRIKNGDPLEYILDEKYFDNKLNNYKKDIPERKNYIRYDDAAIESAGGLQNDPFEDINNAKQFDQQEINKRGSLIEKAITRKYPNLSEKTNNGLIQKLINFAKSDTEIETSKLNAFMDTFMAMPNIKTILQAISTDSEDELTITPPIVEYAKALKSFKAK